MRRGNPVTKSFDLRILFRMDAFGTIRPPNTQIAAPQ